MRHIHNDGNLRQHGCEKPVQYTGHFSVGFTLDTDTHITDDMRRGMAEKIGGFMESVTTANTPEPIDLPEENRCKVIPFEKVG